MFVLDTSAYINGSRDHFFPDMVPGVWKLVEQSIDDGRVILPRAVYVELCEKDDAAAELIKRHKKAVVDPTEEVQKLAGSFAAEFLEAPTRNAADPFILAEARVRGFTVATYEGRTYSGIPTKRWHTKMPGICQHFGIPCCTFPEALKQLGLSLS